MSILHSLIARFKGKVANPFPKSKHVIKPAFESGGIQYFEFDTTANMPYARALAFMGIYTELDCKVDRFFLEKFAEAGLALFKRPKGVRFEEIVQLQKLFNVIDERLKWVQDVNLVYKIASVVFFDANENPDTYEWKYAAEKIERWKKEGVDSFFLHEPIQRLIPYLGNSEVNLDTYSEAQAAVDKQQLESIFMNLSANPKEDLPSFTQRYFYQEIKADSNK